MALETFTITLPKTLADKLRGKVASGDFDSESDVLVAGLMALEEEGPTDSVSEQELMAAYDEDVADPSGALTLEELDEYLAKERRQFLRAG